MVKRMNPLSIWTFYRRHKRSALLLTSLITLATLGLYIMVAVLDSVTLAHAEVSYLKRVSQVYPNIELAFEPGVVSQIQTHPDVERVIPDNGLHAPWWYSWARMDITIREVNVSPCLTASRCRPSTTKSSDL